MKIVLVDCVCDKKIINEENYSDVGGVVKWICCGVCVERSDEYLCMGIFELIFVGLLLYLVVFIYIFFFKDYSDYLCKLYIGFFGILLM